MTIIDDKIRDEKLQCNINREAAKIPALSYGKSDKYEIPYRLRNTISWSKKSDRTSKVYIFSFTKSFWKTNKNSSRTRKKISWSFKSFNGRGTRINCRTFSKNIRTEKIKNEIDKVKKWEDKIKRKD